MEPIILILHVLTSILIVLFVLLQHGKGADIGAQFGGGGSGPTGTIFGSQGHIPFLMKLTGCLAAIFFITSLSLSYLTAHRAKRASLLAQPAIQKTTHAPLPLELPALPSPNTPKNTST